ncbi:Hypothetical predicted protein, partial [Olea europaea subsp. europaea]
MPPQIHDKKQSNSDVSTASLGTVAMGGTGRDLELRLSSGAHRCTQVEPSVTCPAMKALAVSIE